MYHPVYFGTKHDCRGTFVRKYAALKSHPPLFGDNDGLDRVLKENISNLQQAYLKMKGQNSLFLDLIPAHVYEEWVREDNDFAKKLKSLIDSSRDVSFPVKTAQIKTLPTI